MSEQTVCKWDGCFEPKELTCEECKQSFCTKHATKGEYVTKSGKLQYATLCLNDQDVGVEDMRNESDLNRRFQQVGIIVVILIILALIISQLS